MIQGAVVNAAKKIFYSLNEANSIVPQLLDDVPRIQTLASDLRNKISGCYKRPGKSISITAGVSEGTQYLGTALRLNRIMNDLESKGCIVKGIKEGLVDFPSIREGREVYLCWKVPEKEIQFYHEIDSGFAGRKKI